ncbi:hypothetical protein EZ315_15440 (plasmid) [Duncaniella freteri]|uniref:Uncharacterized protein n=3 Tax=Bacteroidales TaxID=171549 RepID=A0A4Z0V1B0_9BACT|nr:hypothetical protein E7746_14530 [Muribaculum gordoncarteri]TGG35156.1 hypothetical protein EZ315_15440 [Duncaniella freteri]
MFNKLLIDGKDAYAEYGVFVEQYGYKALVQMPSFKKLESTEWDEYDGEETDLTSPILDTKTFAIQFCITEIDMVDNLFELLSDKSYHTFHFAELSKSYKLRLVGNPSRSALIHLGKISVNFADDFPPVVLNDFINEDDLDDSNIILNHKPYATAPAGFKQKGYELDDIDFSRFGIYVLDGTDDNIEKAPNVRANLTVNVKNSPGVVYDNDWVMYKSKDVGLKLLIHAPSISDFWQRWYSFWAVVLKPESRKLYIDNPIDEFECHYKSNSVTTFDIRRNGSVWCEFTTTLTFTNCRPLGNYFVLVTEDGEIVITEPGSEDVEINLKLHE